MNFTLDDVKVSRLWDYGCFNVSQFSVSDSEGLASETMLFNFFTSPIYARSYFEWPGAWGDGSPLHGPFFIEHCSLDWFTEISPNELADHLRASVQSWRFARELNRDECEAVYGWANEVLGSSAWKFTPPDDDSIRHELLSLRWPFDEYLVYNEVSGTLSVAAVCFA